MNTVSQILSPKGTATIAVETDTSVLNALKLMAEKNIGSVVVNDNQGVFQGIVTERDYSRKGILQGKSSNELLVQEIMSTDFPKLSLTNSVEHCMEVMTKKYSLPACVFRNRVERNYFHERCSERNESDATGNDQSFKRLHKPVRENLACEQ